MGIFLVEFLVHGGGVLQFAETPLKGCWIYQHTELRTGHCQNFFDVYYIFKGVVLLFTHEKIYEIKFDEKMKKWKFLIFARIKRGTRGKRSNGCMQCILLHLHLLTSLGSEFFYFGINNKVAFAKILNLLFLFYFGIVRYVVMDVVMLPNFHSEDFFIHG